jgi:hypothetical protein
MDVIFYVTQNGPTSYLTFKHYESQIFQNANIIAVQAMASYKYFEP